MSCNKDPDETDPNTSESIFNNGLLVLNEGLFQQNNSTLSWIDLTSDEVTNQVFLAQNNRPLGDTGNDMGNYGSKIYIVVNASSTIEVVDKSSLKSIKQISLQLNNQGQQPRSIEFYDGKAYISSYDGYVNVLDTSSLTIVDRIEVGANPEGITTSDGYLYVSNSGGLSFPDVDSTVFKVDLNSNLVIDTFIVGNNPGDIDSDLQGDLYVVKRGDYSSNDPSELIRISNNGVITNTGISASSIKRHGEYLYISYYNYDNGEGQIQVYDMIQESIVTSNLIDASLVQTLYGAIPDDNGSVYALDAMSFTNSGYIREFSSSGSIIQSFHVGLNPTKLIIYD
jgi:hypothetical protein